MRPDYVTQEHLEYLDGLRESGVTSMWGATTYIVRHFSVTVETGRKILVYWMESFGKEDR